MSAERSSLLLHDKTETADYNKCSPKPKCPYRSYEIERLVHIRHQIDRIKQAFETSAAPENDCQVFDCCILPSIQNILTNIETLKSDLNEPLTIENYKARTKLFCEIKILCANLLELLSEYELPNVKPKWADFTDAGPRVDVDNYEVKFKDAELARIFTLDYQIRIHRSRGDSGQNGVERTNSGCGDSIVDGGTIVWEKFKRFEGMITEDIRNMGIKKSTKFMKNNVWAVSEELQHRIDDAPTLGEHIKAFLAEENRKGFFFNTSFLTKYTETSEAKRNELPGFTYIKKIWDFYNNYETGELYMEYLKKDCPEARKNMQL